MELTLHKAQAQIIRDNHRFRVVVCGRKFGKTTLAAEEIAGCAISRKGRRVLYISPTLDDSRRLMWERLRRKLAGAIVKENDTRLELKVKTIDGGTSEIFLGSWEKVQNYRGDEYDLIVPDEIQDYKNFWIGWQEALRPTLTPRKGSALLMGTPKGYNHLYDLNNLELNDSDYKSYHFSTYDNPFIPVEEIEKARSELTSERFAQEYMALFTKTEGLVYKEFSREQHVYSHDERGFSMIIGAVDWGFRNPAAVPHVGIKGEHFYVFNEFYKTETTDAKVADYVAACKFSQVYPDPESASGIEELKQRRVNVREVIKGKDSIIHGIDKVRELLLTGRLHIHSSCINLISEFETYSYPDSHTERNESELPIDDNNHILDALRYIAMMYQPTRPHIQRPFHDNITDIWKM